MKHALTFVCSIATAAVAAQCTYTDLGFTGQTHVRWCDGHVLPDGSMLATAVPIDAYGQNEPILFGGVFTMRLDPAGNVTDSRYFHTVDPYVRLYPTKILPTPSGGMFLIGHRVAYWCCENFFAMELDAAGDLVWAKILMEPVGSYSEDMAWNLDAVQLAGGGYAVVFPCGDGITRVTLDATGTPIGHKRYRLGGNANYAYYIASAQLVEADGSALYAGHVIDGDTLINDTTVLVHTDATGEPDWSLVVDTSEFVPASITATNDGGYVIAGGLGEPAWNGYPSSATLMKVNASGTPLWKKHYGEIGRFNDVQELDNGELVMSVGRRWGYAYSNEDTVAYLRTSATGDVLDALRWADGQPTNDMLFWALIYGLVDGGTELVGLRGDSIILASTVLGTDSGSYHPGMVIAEDVSALGCGMDAVSVVATDIPVLSGIPFTSEIWSDTARVWDMAVGLPVSSGELELISFLGAGAARPGFNVDYYPHVANWGGLSSGPITTTLTADPILTFVDAWPTPTSIAGNTLTWADTTTLGQFDGLGHHARFTVPVATPLGTPLSATVTHSQPNTEVTLANNTFTRNQLVTGSFDPNDKLVWPRDLYHIENDSVLDYTIRFQNTGTDTAFTVVVVDTLPLDVDVTTIRFGAASHPYTYELTGNGILRFTFGNILLPDSNTNEPLSHGLVNFRIEPILPLSLGQEITNAADIYFDFNSPVRTPDATVVVTDETGVHPAVKPEKLSVFPVPVRTTLTAQLPAGFDPVNATAIGTDGRRVPLLRPNVVEKRAEYGVQHLPPGAYVLTLVDRSGKRMSARFTKE